MIGVTRRIGLLSTLSILLMLLTSLVADFFHKEGLVLNLCFVLIPLVMPAGFSTRQSFSLFSGRKVHIGVISTLGVDC